MIPMIARKPIVYAGKRIAKGGRFSARGAQDARLLEAIGHAVKAPVAQVPMPAPFHEVRAKPSTYTYRATAPKPIAEATVDSASGHTSDDVSSRTGKPKRQYKRRDMTAEE